MILWVSCLQDDAAARLEASEHAEATGTLGADKAEVNPAAGMRKGNQELAVGLDTCLSDHVRLL